MHLYLAIIRQDIDWKSNTVKEAYFWYYFADPVETSFCQHQNCKNSWSNLMLRRIIVRVYVTWWTSTNRLTLPLTSWRKTCIYNEIAVRTISLRIWDLAKSSWFATQQNEFSVWFSKSCCAVKFTQVGHLPVVLKIVPKCRFILSTTWFMDVSGLWFYMTVHSIINRRY